MDLKIRDKTGTKEEEILKSYLQSNDADLIITTIGCISELYQGNYRNLFFETIYNGGNIEIIESCIYALMRIYGDSIINEISTEKCDQETNKFIEYMKEE
ncbi:hypothetical protein FACS1894172_21410 [Spirochaetia bacterium]|nr:hypothetical protein FACS1894172_21410 [Spirochaetia bacterium]